MSEVIGLLREMVATPSVTCGVHQGLDETHGEGRMVELVADFWRRSGIDYEIQTVLPGRENVVACIEGGNGPSLILEAHTDTVEVENMQIDPFDPVVKDGRVYGRGSCDDKASLAAMMIAVRNVAEKGLPGTVTLAAAANEECGHGGVVTLLESGLHADGAVVGEPTLLQVVVAHKGACRLDITTHGVAAHSSEPHKGKNAIYAMARIIQAVEAHAEQLNERPKHPLVSGPTCSVGMIDGGQAPNVVPDRCEISVDRRMIPGECSEDAEQEILAVIAAAVGDEVTWSSELAFDDYTLETDPECRVARCALQAVEAVTGDNTVIGVQYGTDASNFSHAGIPSVVLGPGSIAQAHTAVEYVEIEQVEKAVLIYKRLCLQQ